MATQGIKPDHLPVELLSEGVSTFDVAYAQARTGLPTARVHDALKRLADAGEIFSPARGFYVVIPPQYRGWGAVPAAWFVDPMMAHLGRRYYVGLLSAAELGGVAHQRPQAFQVVTDKHLTDRAFGRVRLQFLVSRHVADLATSTVNTPAGVVRVSTPEVTALDLANRPLAGGGLANVATVLVELDEHRPLDETSLVSAVGSFPNAAARRLGLLLEAFAGRTLDDLWSAAAPAGREPAPLDPSGPRRGQVDPRWRIRHNTEIEPDL